MVEGLPKNGAREALLLVLLLPYAVSALKARLLMMVLQSARTVRKVVFVQEDQHQLLARKVDTAKMVSAKFRAL